MTVYPANKNVFWERCCNEKLLLRKRYRKRYNNVNLDGFFYVLKTLPPNIVRTVIQQFRNVFNFIKKHFGNFLGTSKYLVGTLISL